MNSCCQLSTNLSLAWRIQWLWMYWRSRAFPWTVKKFDTWSRSCFWILMVGDAFKANGREIVVVFNPVMMVRRSGGFGVAWVFIRGRAINIMCRRIRVARSVIWRWITWLVQFKPYGLSTGLKSRIGTRWWRIARHLVCCLFTFPATASVCSLPIGNFRKYPQESERSAK